MLQCGTFKMGTGTNNYCDFQCIIGCKDFLPNILDHVTTYILDSGCLDFLSNAGMEQLLSHPVQHGTWNTIGLAV